jgi:hypothetical protein
MLIKFLCNLSMSSTLKNKEVLQIQFQKEKYEAIQDQSRSKQSCLSKNKTI